MKLRASEPLRVSVRLARPRLELFGQEFGPCVMGEGI